MTDAQPFDDLAHLPLRLPELSVLEALTTTRAIRRYTDEPVPEADLRDMLFAATRAPSGSNRQPFRFVVLTTGEKAERAKALIGEAGRAVWEGKRTNDGYDSGSGADSDSPKARMARTMEHYVDRFESVPVLVLACIARYRAPNPTEGASVYPACQNLLVAARALGYGGVLTGFHHAVEPQLRELLGIPDDVGVSATITIGRPAGAHGPVRRRPMRELVFGDSWGQGAAWAIDPPGTTFTQAGPPRERR